MRLLGMTVVTAALASLLWTSERAAGLAGQPGERRNLLGVWELAAGRDMFSTTRLHSVRPPDMRSIRLRADVYAPRVSAEVGPSA